MKLKLVTLFVLLGILPFVSGEIFVQQLNGIYNVGDEINSQVSVIPNSNIADHFKVDMICGNVRTNIYNQYLNLQQGTQHNVNADTQVIEPYFTSITFLNNTNTTTYQNLSTSGNNSVNNSGNSSNIKKLVTKYNNCRLDISYGPESVESNIFGVSQNILVDADLNLDRFSPKEKVSLVGTATKESGRQVNGFIELFVKSLGIYKTGTITNGQINLDFLVPDEAKSGKHNLTVRTYESNFLGEKTNEGYYEENFKVNQILKELKILTNSVTASPGAVFTFSVETYDQAGDIIPQDISVVVYKPGDFVFLKKLIKPKSEQKINFALNDTPGYWKIEATAGELQARKIFYVEEASKIQTSLINDTLIVANVGNVPYEGHLEITIGSTVEVKQLKLGFGEIKKFKLKAPDGNYQISINDGSVSSVLGNSFLTGNAVRIIDIRTGFLEALGNPLIWWLAVMFFVLIVVFVYLKRYFAIKKPAVKSSAGSISPITQKTEEITHGSREHAYVVAVKIRANNSEIVNETVKSALHMAKSLGARVYIDGDYKLIILSPKLNNVAENGPTAINIAKKVEEMLNKHNGRYAEKIAFGIGINEGEIISEISNNQFKFTTTGGLISASKRLAQNEKMKILLSESANRKVSGAVKTQKSAEGNYWEIIKITDREQYKDFLDRFKKRI